MSVLKCAAFAALLSLGSTHAYAHVTLEKPEATVGAPYKGVLRVPHGCGQQATQALRINLPPELVAVKPMPKAGWTLETKSGPYPLPFNNHGHEMREGVREIFWSGGHLADAHYDEFVFVGTIAPSASQDKLTVSVTQICASAQEVWTPALQLIKQQAKAQPQIYTIGDLTISGAWTRATPKGAPVAGGFVTITNKGASSDVLIGGTFANSGAVEIHEMSMEHGVMKMRALTQGLEIKPGETIELKPGGYHLMFMQLNTPNTEGERVKGSLTFRKAGKVEIDFAVAPIGGPKPDMPAGHEHHH